MDRGERLAEPAVGECRQQPAVVTLTIGPRPDRLHEEHLRESSGDLLMTGTGPPAARG